MERRFNTVDDDILASDADLTVPLGEYGWLTKAQAKAGLSVSRKDRSNETFVFSFLPTDEADLTERPNEFFDPGDQGDKFTIRNDTTETDNYTGALDITEQYAMLDLELFEALKFNLGLRRLEATIEISPRGDSPNAGFDHVRYLPGVSVTWNFLEDMNLRAAYSETYSLPLLTEIAPVNFTDPDSGRAFQGNPDLKPTETKALDVRWEREATGPSTRCATSTKPICDCSAVVCWHLCSSRVLLTT